MIRTKPPTDAYRDGWDSVFGEAREAKAETCPACGSENTRPFDFGDDMMSTVLRTHYPDARECGSCDHGWSPTRESEKQAFREMGFKLVKRQATP